MTEQEEMGIELGPFIAAIIEQEGGVYRIPFQNLVQQQGDRALAIDFEDDGATVALRIVEITEEGNE